MRKIVSLILLLLWIFCAYTAFIAYQAKDSQSVWFFTAFSFLFSIPLGVFALQMLGLIGPPTEPRGTRFVPHWFVMTTILIMGLGILVRVIINIFKS